MRNRLTRKIAAVAVFGAFVVAVVAANDAATHKYDAPAGKTTAMCQLLHPCYDPN